MTDVRRDGQLATASESRWERDGLVPGWTNGRLRLLRQIFIPSIHSSFLIQPPPRISFLRNLVLPSASMESSFSSSKRRPTPPALPLIPCPYCKAKIITPICGPHGSKPGHRYYKCTLKDAGKCKFYEWQEGYDMYLLDEQDAELTEQALSPDAITPVVAAMTTLNNNFRDNFQASCHFFGRSTKIHLVDLN